MRLEEMGLILDNIVREIFYPLEYSVEKNPCRGREGAVPTSIVGSTIQLISWRK